MTLLKKRELSSHVGENRRPEKGIPPSGFASLPNGCPAARRPGCGKELLKGLVPSVQQSAR